MQCNAMQCNAMQCNAMIMRVPARYRRVVHGKGGHSGRGSRKRPIRSSKDRACAAASQGDQQSVIIFALSAFDTNQFMA